MLATGIANNLTGRNSHNNRITVLLIKTSLDNIVRII